MGKRSEKQKGRERKTQAKPSKDEKVLNFNVRKDPWMLATFLLAALTIVSVVFNWNITGFFAATSSGDGRSEFGSSAAAATIDLFVMSQCPYGVQAESGIIDALAAFGSDLQVNIRFIVSETSGAFSSLHGQPELDEDLRQLCIVQYYPGEYFDYLDCFNSAYSTASAQFGVCAAQLGFDESLITGCMDDDATLEMLRGDIALEAENSIRGSPTYYINGEKYTGGRDAASLQSYICANVDSSLDGCSAQLSGSVQQATGGCG